MSRRERREKDKREQGSNNVNVNLPARNSIQRGQELVCRSAPRRCCGHHPSSAYESSFYQNLRNMDRMHTITKVRLAKGQSSQIVLLP